MSGGGGWEPIHHEDADESVQDPATKPRETKPKEPAAIPLTMVMSVPPELIAALSSLAGTMERIATEVAAQGKAILALVEANSRQDSP